MGKQEIWDSIAVRVGRTCDLLRMPIDPGIKETVIVLQALGFSTTQSCEGHDDRGLPYPWVKIECDEGDRLKSHNDDMRIAQYLEEFYFNYRSLRWARLSLDHLRGTVTIQPFIGKTAKKLKQANAEEYKILRENCTAEMDAFTMFLKEKFWNQ